jgi:hypothetical protein
MNQSLQLQGISTTWCSASTSLTRDDHTLWTYESAYPEGPLDLPFSMALPADLPMSFFARSGLDWGAISYHLEVVAERHGALCRARRMGQALPVISRAQAEHVTSADLLR